MTRSQDPTSLVALASEVFQQPGRARTRLFSFLAVAVAGHLAAASYALGRAREVEPERLPVEVELLAPTPEEVPPPPPAEAPSPPEPVPASTPVVRAAAPPPAARAAALITAKAEQPSDQRPDEPFDFTSDPNGTQYGGGVVAVGGTADFGVRGAAPVRVAAQAPRATTQAFGDAVLPLADLSRRPALGEADPCRGFFPGAASYDSAETSVFVVVSKSGRVTQARVVRETPSGQGFGAAARACMLSKTFTPALDRAGSPAATSLRVNVRFRR
jgi:protein TonB